jgi:hypothetical protein
MTRPAISNQCAAGPSPDVEAQRLRATLQRSAAESDKISPPPPGIERQYFDGPFGVPTRNRKLEYDLAVHSLKRLAAERDYATARLTIIWLWQSAQVTYALNQDSRADLVAELPRIQESFTRYQRERSMLVDAHGVDQSWKSEKLVALDEMIEKHKRSLNAIGSLLKRPRRGRPSRPEVFDDLVATFALLIAVRQGAERATSYREVAEGLLFWSPETNVKPGQVRDIKRDVTVRIRREAGRARYPIFTMLSEAWASDVSRIKANPGTRAHQNSQREAANKR